MSEYGIGLNTQRFVYSECGKYRLGLRIKHASCDEMKFMHNYFLYNCFTCRIAASSSITNIVGSN